MKKSNKGKVLKDALDKTTITYQPLLKDNIVLIKPSDQFDTYTKDEINLRDTEAKQAAMGYAHDQDVIVLSDSKTYTDGKTSGILAEAKAYADDIENTLDGEIDLKEDKNVLRGKPVLEPTNDTYMYFDGTSYIPKKGSGTGVTIEEVDAEITLKTPDVQAVKDNTAKVGITTEQAEAIVANSAKVGGITEIKEGSSNVHVNEVDKVVTISVDEGEPSPDLPARGQIKAIQGTENFDDVPPITLTNAKSAIEANATNIGNVLTEAEAYADEQDAKILTSAEAYADGKDADVLADAKLYADGIDTKLAGIITALTERVTTLEEEIGKVGNSFGQIYVNGAGPIVASMPNDAFDIRGEAGIVLDPDFTNKTITIKETT